LRMAEVVMLSKMLKSLVAACALVMLVALVINLHVVRSASGRLVRDGDYSKIGDADCIIILGAGIWGNEPSPMLADRLQQGIDLYHAGVAPKIIMSGDHGRPEHDEVNIMKSYAIDRGVPSEDIFMDHAGFSTYESMFRARDVFLAKKVVIVTQEYHLYRAVYIADRLGLEAYGVNSDPRPYAGQLVREIREVLARDKDFFKCILKPNPTFLGDPIPITGNGDATNG